MKRKIMPLIMLLLVYSLMFNALAAVGTDILDTFEKISNANLKALITVQSDAANPNPISLSIDSSTCPANVGRNNSKSLRADFSIIKGEQWAHLKIGIENPLMLEDNFRGSNDGVVTFYAKGAKQIPMRVAMIVKDQVWEYYILLSTDWKRYDIPVNSFFNKAYEGRTISELVKNGTYNEGYFSQLIFTVKSIHEVSGIKTGAIASTYWLDEISISGTGVKNEESEYGRDVPASSNATTTSAPKNNGGNTTKADKTTVKNSGGSTTAVGGNNTETRNTSFEADTTATGEETSANGEQTETTASLSAESTKSEETDTENGNSLNILLVIITVISAATAIGVILFFTVIKKK